MKISIHRIHQKIFKKYIWYILFVLAGAVGGYLYWYHTGCKSGTCPITSHWYSASLYGVMLGYLSGDLLKGLFKKNRKKNIP
ncbi:MAG: hypothetical protein JW723_03770 [Bacteroidales bacterium]|nr:hypothetical protein [Bacteroidales bacterium]